jgi:hypothetical protein
MSNSESVRFDVFIVEYGFSLRVVRREAVRLSDSSWWAPSGSRHLRRTSNSQMFLDFGEAKSFAEGIAYRRKQRAAGAAERAIETLHKVEALTEEDLPWSAD